MADSQNKKLKEDPQAEANRRRKKTVSVRKLAENIRSLRNKVTRDMKSDDEKMRMTALAVALIDKTAERVGNESSAKDGHYGVTGWCAKHVAIDGDKVTIKYVGKSGVDHEKAFTDKAIAKMLKDAKDRCGSGDKRILSCGDGFEINADKVNRYLRDYGVTAKDLRGFRANSLIVEALKRSVVSKDRDERKKKFQDVVSNIAEKVGHQKATLRKHYLLPGIEGQYVSKGTVPSVRKASWTVRRVTAGVTRTCLAHMKLIRIGSTNG